MKALFLVYLHVLAILLAPCVRAGNPPSDSASFNIVLPEHAARVTGIAARELAEHLRQATGRDVPIVSDQKAEPDAKVHTLALKEDPEARDLPAHPQGFAIETENRQTVIRSRSPHGILYGVYDFLENDVGCRWYAPDETLVPKRPDLSIAEGRRMDAPVFSYRELYAKDVFADRRWAQRLRIDGGCYDWPDRFDDHLFHYMPGYSVHTFDRLVPSKQYFAGHPEYYGLVNGKRDKNILCLSNPRVFDVALAQLKKDLAAFPDRPLIISISQNDCGGWCMCPECRRIVEQEENGVPTGLLIRFLNRFDEALKGENVSVHTLAYFDTDTPPAVTQPNPGVIIQLCPIGVCYAHGPEECGHKANVAFRGNLEGWSRMHKNLWIWSYHVNFYHSLQPFPNIHTLGIWFRFFADHHATGVFAQSDAMNPAVSLSRLRHYVIAKLLWNPHQDEKKLIEEFLEGYYREGAPAMREYLALLQGLVEGKPEIVTWIYESPLSPHFTVEFVLSAEKIFDDALAQLAPDSVAARRLRSERLSSDYMVLEFWKAGRLKRDANAILAQIDRLESGCTEFRVHGLSEHDWDTKTRQEWFHAMREHASKQQERRDQRDASLLTRENRASGN